MKRLSQLREEVDMWRGLDGRAVSLQELVDLSVEENDESLLDSFAEETRELEEALADLEFRLTLSGDHDQRNAIVALHAGAGGVESQDWVRMLMRMYLRWSERKGFAGEVLRSVSGR